VKHEQPLPLTREAIDVGARLDKITHSPRRQDHIAVELLASSGIKEDEPVASHIAKSADRSHVDADNHSSP